VVLEFPRLSVAANSKELIACP